MKEHTRRFEVVSAGPMTYIALPSGVLLPGQFGSRREAQAYLAACDVDAVVDDWCDDLTRQLEALDTTAHPRHDLWRRLCGLRATLRSALCEAEALRAADSSQDGERGALYDRVRAAYHAATDDTLKVQVEMEDELSAQL